MAIFANKFCLRWKIRDENDARKEAFINEDLSLLRACFLGCWLHMRK